VAPHCCEGLRGLRWQTWAWGFWCVKLMFLVTRCPVPNAASGVKTWPGEASQTLFLTCTVSGFSLTTNNINWVCQLPGKGLQWMDVIWSNGNTHNPTHKSHLTINKDPSKSQVSLTVSSLRTEDMAICYCGRDTVMGLECECRQKPPCRGNQD
jgi:hypothetical protein